MSFEYNFNFSGLLGFVVFFAMVLACCATISAVAGFCMAVGFKLFSMLIG